MDESKEYSRVLEVLDVPVVHPRCARGTLLKNELKRSLLRTRGLCSRVTTAVCVREVLRS
jgi:hypothetical protein